MTERNGRILTNGMTVDEWAKSKNASVAEEFVLVDSKGRRRASLDVQAKGAGLTVVDGEGRPRAALVAFEDGSAYLFTVGACGSGSRVMMGHDDTGVANVTIVEHNRIRVSLNRHGVVLYGDAGNPTVSISTREDGTGAVEFFDPDGSGSVKLDNRLVSEVVQLLESARTVGRQDCAPSSAT